MTAAFTALVSFVTFAAGGDDGVTATGGGAAGAGTVAVSLTELAISPATTTLAEGGSLEVTNDGSMVHNLAVKGHDELVTADLGGGERGTSTCRRCRRAPRSCGATSPATGPPG